MGNPKYKTASEMQKAVDAYFKSRRPEPVLDSDGKQVTTKDGPVYKMRPPTVTGLALYLGFKDKISFYEQEKRDDKFAEVCTKARTRLEEFHEENLSIRDRCTGDIFWMKNHGWTDERVISGALHVASVSLSEDEERLFKENMNSFFGGKGARGK